MGGIDPTRDYVLRALDSGRHVVTANKQLLSQHGEEVFDAARRGGVQLRFEGAVAGVVPAIRVMSETLAAAHIERVHGIVNGTTNYILSEMARTGATYEEALAEAQRLGYAEADPTEDVTGKDAAAKMAILARLAFNAAGAARPGELRGHRAAHRRRHRVREGARPVAEADRLGRADRQRRGRARVSRPSCTPTTRSRRVNGAFNAVTIESPAITEITLSGPGRGRHPDRERRARRRGLGDDPAALAAGRRRVDMPLVTDTEFSFYLHLEVADRPGVLAQVAEILGLQGVSIKSVVQKGLGDEARLVMVMHPVLESKFRAAVELISRLDFVREPPRVIRVIEETLLSLWRYRGAAAGRAARDDGRGRHAAGPGAAPLRAHRLRRLAEARGREPDRLVQGPRHDRGGVGRGRARAPRR